MMISESTIFPSSSMPACATFCRLPSNLKGRVTTATVRIPRSLATCADYLDDRFLRALVNDFKHDVLLCSCRIEGIAALRSRFCRVIFRGNYRRKSTGFARDPRVILVALATENRRALPAILG